LYRGSVSGPNRRFDAVAQGGGRAGHPRHHPPHTPHPLGKEKGIEFRCFNGTTHAGKIKTYIQLCLAISNQALTQNGASAKKTVTANEKYTFRTWLLRLGMIGDEFETARKFLLENLSGDIAFKNGRPGVAA